MLAELRRACRASFDDGFRFSGWPCTIFGVHQADSPKRVLRFRPVIAEHPILCEDIDMGRYAELRRVRWAGSLSSIICKTNVFTKKMRKSPTFPRVHQAGAPKKFTEKIFKWLETWWNLGVRRQKKYVSNEFSRGIRFRAQKLKIPSISRRNYFLAKKHLSIFLYFPDRKSQNRLATFGRVRTNVPRSVAHWFWILRIPGRLS